MKISRPSTNQLIWVEQWPTVQTLFVGAILFVFLMVDLQFIRAVERTVYQCDRINSSVQASCHRIEKAYLGLVTVHREPFEGVTQAQAHREVKEGSSYRYELHSVAVTTPSGEKTLVEPPVMRAGRRGDPVEMNEIATQLNAFLQSNQPQWHLQTWGQEIVILILIITYMTGFIAFALVFLARQIGPITYSLERQNAISAQSETFLFTRQDRWGKRQVTFGRPEIVEFKVVRSVVGGKHRRVVYSPLLKLRNHQPLLLANGGHQLHAEKILREAKHFLRPPLSAQILTAQTLISTNLQPIEQEIFKGRHGHYYTTGTSTIPTSETQKILRVAADLLRLGGQYLGDLSCSKFSWVIVYAYAIPRLKSYALIYKFGYYAGTDYYTRLSNGRSLTTTSRLVAFIGWGEHKPYFRSHFGLDARQLYQRHQQHLNTFERQLLEQAQPMVPALEAVAQEMDRHLCDRKGLLLSL